MYNKMSDVRSYIARTWPWFRGYLLRYRIIPTDRVPAMRSDSRMRLAVNPEWVRKASVYEVAITWLDILFHDIRAHRNRRRGRAPKQWAHATHRELVDDLDIFARLNQEALPDWLERAKDKRKNGLTAEEYYREDTQQSSSRKRNQQQQQKQQQKQQQGRGQSQQQQQQQQQGQSQQQQQGQSQQQQSQRGEDQSAPCGIDSDPDDSLFGNVPPAPEALTKELAKKLYQHMSKEQREKYRGTIPLGLLRVLEDYVQPSRRDWRTELRENLRLVTSGKDDYSWRKRNRRQHAYGDVLMPGYIGYTARVAILVDTSGSMSAKELELAFSEVKAIADAVNTQFIGIACDSRVHAKIETGDAEEFKRLIKGGGGSDFRPAFKEVEDEYVDAIIGITDGHISVPKYVSTPVFWVLTPYHRIPTEEYGKVIVMEDSNG